MEKFLVGYSDSVNWNDAVLQCLRQVGEIPSYFNFGFLYVTEYHNDNLAHILDNLKQRTPIKHWTGTVGIGVCCTNREFYEQPAVSMLLGYFPDNSFRIIRSVGEGADSSLDIMTIQEHFGYFGIVHGDPRNPDLPELIEKFARQNNFLTGGVTSAQKSYLQIADELTQGGLSGVVFSEQVDVVTGLTQGCTPIGPIHEITDCQDNIIISLDNRPALDVFYEDIGELLARDVRRVAGYIFAGFPVRGSDTGDYLVRNLVGIDTGSRLLAVGEMLSPGETVMFCRRDGKSARVDMDRMLVDIKRRIGKPPKGGVYYSCLGRGRHLFGDNSEELKSISQHIGEVPLVGFFANGEISNHRLYGYTGVLTLFL
jgi:small ligand-binding sensory domain FIST